AGRSRPPAGAYRARAVDGGGGPRSDAVHRLHLPRGIRGRVRSGARGGGGAGAGRGVLERGHLDARRFPMSRRADNQAITVSGPGLEPRRCASLGAGLSLAQHRAMASPTGTTFYVREGETALYWIERDDHGATTRPAIERREQT